MKNKPISLGMMDKAEAQEWEVKQALSTLVEAKKIQENSALMKKVKALAKQKVKAMQDII